MFGNSWLIYLDSLLGIKIGYMVVVFILAASFTVIPTIL